MGESFERKSGVGRRVVVRALRSVVVGLTAVTLVAAGAGWVVLNRADEQVQANAVTLGSWDHQRLSGLAGLDTTAPLGALPVLEVYDGSGASRFADPAKRLQTVTLNEANHALRQLFAEPGYVRIEKPLFSYNGLSVAIVAALVLLVLIALGWRIWRHRHH